MTKSTILITLLITAPIGAEDFRIRLKDDRQASILNQTLKGATRRVNRPFCQEVLKDFDLTGSLTDQIKLITFVDDKCQADRTAATMPGSRVVWVCGSKLKWTYHNNPRKAELLLIHELLHTLGLGENPPSPNQINTQVRFRCGG